MALYTATFSGGGTEDFEDDRTLQMLAGDLIKSGYVRSTKVNLQPVVAGNKGQPRVGTPAGEVVIFASSLQTLHPRS